MDTIIHNTRMYVIHDCARKYNMHNNCVNCLNTYFRTLRNTKEYGVFNFHKYQTEKFEKKGIISLNQWENFCGKL